MVFLADSQTELFTTCLSNERGIEIDLKLMTMNNTHPFKSLDTEIDDTE